MRLLFVLLLATPALAQPAPGSNMPADFYPHSSCEKPPLPPKGAPGISDQQAALVYNQKVKLYNEKANAFNACTKVYVDNAQRDIAQIQAIVHAAVADANAH